MTRTSAIAVEQTTETARDLNREVEPERKVLRVIRVFFLFPFPGCGLWGVPVTLVEDVIGLRSSTPDSWRKSINQQWKSAGDHVLSPALEG
jgi:hypothetical protein